MKILFGWRPDPLHKKITPKRLKAGAVVLPASKNINVLSPADVLQQVGGSCCGYALAQGMRLSMMLRGDTRAPLPSPRWIYRLARETHGEGHIDDGTYIYCATGAVKRLGWCPDDVCRMTSRTINRGLTITHRRKAIDQRGSGLKTYSVFTQQDVKQAIATYHPIIIGMDVDKKFCEAGDWGVQTVSGSKEGGHALLVVGYDQESFHVMSSWSPVWGYLGCARVAWEVLPRVRDRTAISYVRPLSEKK